MPSDRGDRATSRAFGVAVGIALGVVGRFGSAAFGLASFVMISRWLGPPALAEFVISMGWFQLFQQTSLLGLQFVIIRDVAARCPPLEQVVGCTTALAVAFALLAAVTLMGIDSIAYEGSTRRSVAIIAVALVPTAIISGLEALLVGQGRLGAVSSINLVEGGLRCLSLFAVIHLGRGLDDFFLVFTALRAGTLVVMITTSALARYMFRPTLSRAVLISYAKKLPVLGGIALTSTLLARFDIIYLSGHAGVDEIAAYGIAARVYDLTLMASGILLTALLPLMSRTDFAQSSRFSLFLSLLAQYGSLVGTACAIVVAAGAAPAIRAVFGLGFAEAAHPLYPLLAAAVITAGNQICAGVFLLRERLDLDLLCLCLAATVLAASCFALAPVLGTVGVALAVAVSAAVQLCVRVVLIDSLVGVRIDLHRLRAPLGAAMTSVVVMFLAGEAHLTLAVAMCFSAAVAVVGVGRGKLKLIRKDLVAARLLVEGSDVE